MAPGEMPKKSLVDSKADMLMYGMGERTILRLAYRLENGEKIGDITDLEQTVVLRPLSEMPAPDADNIILTSYDECLHDKKAHATNFKHIEQQSNRYDGGATIWQPTGDIVVRANPMLPAMTQGEIDAAFDLPYTRLPHPRYRGKTIPAYEMIRHSVNLHRGCFGGCAFCTICRAADGGQCRDCGKARDEGRRGASICGKFPCPFLPWRTYWPRDRQGQRYNL